MEGVLRKLAIEEIFSPERWECAKERLLELVLGLRYEPEEEDDDEREEDGTLRAPLAAMDAMEMKSSKSLKVLVCV